MLENVLLGKLETQRDVSEYDSGIYFIKMTDDLGSRHVKKYIKRLIMKTTTTFKSLPHTFLMRVVLCLFGVLFSSQAYAQHEDLLDKTWYLYKLEIDGEEYEYYYYTPNTRTANDESRIEIMDYDINKLTAAVEFDGCPGWGMFLTIEFVENEEKFILSDFGGLTLEYCYYWQDSVEHEIIEEFFFSFYHNYGSIVEYSLETINNIEFLIFTDEN